jgi:hypothetical protein
MVTLAFALCLMFAATLLYAVFAFLNRILEEVFH